MIEPIVPILNHCSFPLRFMKGKIINECDRAISVGNPLEETLCLPYLHMSGISAAKALWGISNKVTENLVKTANINNHKNRNN